MLHLTPMTQREFDAWLEEAIAGYADDKARSGAWTAEEAPDQSREEFGRLLPEGLATKANLILSIVDQEIQASVGVIWVAVDETRRRAFIYDFAIHEQYRRLGYGTQALLALDDVVRSLGLNEVSLHVFGHNTAARTLYEKAGYQITDLSMTKRLR